MPTHEVLVGDPGTVLPSDDVPTSDTDLPADRWFPKSPLITQGELDAMPKPGEEAPPVPSGDPPDVSDKPDAGINRDKWAASVLAEAWPLVLDIEATPAMLQAVQAISRLESRYGWPDPKRFPNWQGHHNWGSIQCVTRTNGVTRSCFQQGGCVKGFLGKDSLNGRPYEVCFESRPTNLEGAKRFLEVLLINRPAVFAAVKTGDAYQIALAMRRSSYFVRTLPPKGTPAEQVEKAILADAAYYAKAIIGGAQAIAAATGEPLAVTAGTPKDVKPSFPENPQWPTETTDLSGIEMPVESSGVVVPVMGLLTGIGVGLLGIWGLKKWVSHDRNSEKDLPPRARGRRQAKTA